MSESQAELPPLEERPLVTFALFAYNQEKYIREAIEGAFAQTYEPLEIILSDDCSTDRTFEIMEEMAAGYSGNHKVRLRRSEINLGTAQHVYAVSVLARGSLLVVAAGDDISAPNRSKELVDIWIGEESPVACIHSAATAITDNSDNGVYRPARTPTLDSKSQRLDLLHADKLPFLSPTCAYSIELFRRYDPLIGGSIIEDGVMSLRSLLSGRVISVDKPLVRIRVLDETAGTGYSVDSPLRWNRFVLSRMISYANKLKDISEAKVDDELALRLEKHYAKKFARLSLFLVKPHQKLSILRRVLFIIRYIIFYPSSASMANRIADAINLAGFAESNKFKFFVRLYKASRG